MASAKAFLGGLVASVLFREAEVTDARAVGGAFRHIDLAGAGLVGLAWTRGDKVQVFLPGVGTRTYSPLAWDADAGTTSLLAHVRGAETPGDRWAATVARGDRCRIFGPRASLATGGKPFVVFGDETSFGLARALAGAGGLGRAVFEVTSAAACREASATLELGEVALVERAAGDAHLNEVHERLAAARAASPDAVVLLTGHARSIATLRRFGKRDGGAANPYLGAKTRAYWADGKAGLD